MEYDGARKYLEAAKWTLEGNPITRAVNLLHYRQQEASYADADVLNHEVSTWLDQTDERPFFMFLNYMDAHEPYNPSEEDLSKFRKGSCSVDIAWHLRSLNETYSDPEVECINDKYDACLNFLDNRVENLFKLLKDHNIEDETMIILTADHGKCLSQNNYMGVGTFLYDELINVPLIISLPGENKSRTESDYTDQIDLHNMILRSAGIEQERDQLDGIISETLGPHQDVTVTGRQLPKQGLRRINQNGHTFIRDVETDEIIQSSFNSDESESTLEQIEKKYLHQRESIGNETDEKKMDDDVKNQLEQLGYL
jgi:arylsulfatase A-like enzyme